MALLDYLHTLVNAMNIFSNVCCIQPDTSFFKTSNDPEILLQTVKTLPAFRTSCNPNTHEQYSFYREDQSWRYLLVGTS